MAKAAVRRQRGFAYKLLLLPYAALFYWLMGLFDLNNLDFLSRFGDFWATKNHSINLIAVYRQFSDATRNSYALNFLCFAMWIAGLIVLIAAPKKYRAITWLGLLMFLMPVWFQCDPANRPSVSEKDVLAINWSTRIFVYELVTAFTAALPVRGDSKSEWIKGVIAPIMLAVYALVCLSGMDMFDLFMLYMKLLPLTLLTGFVVDYAYNGFSWQALLPALIPLLGALFEAVAPSAMNNAAVWECELWSIAALSLVSIIVLLIRRPMQNNSLGGIMALMLNLLNALLFLAVFVWKIEMPVIF